MSAVTLDKDAIKELAKILTETDLSEIEYDANGVKIRVARQIIHTSVAASPLPSSPIDAQPVPAAKPEDHPGTLKSPMVGTAYLSPEPGAPSFVKAGDSVSAGQSLLIIEAMKVMNPIKAPRAGIVKKVLVEDAQPVEFNTPLIIIE